MKGLVLCGGKSSRMGQDKSGLIYRKKPIREEIYDMLKLYCDEVYYSCNMAQFQDWKNNYPIITDDPRWLNHGPLSGVISAINTDSESDWLICACDYPLVRLEIFEKLLLHLYEDAPAIIYHHPETNIPEPLIGIYKKGMLEILLKELEQNNDSLRRILSKTGAKILHTDHSECFTSADTSETYQSIKKQIG